uniref:Uncharacterized protein n=1 Tax=Ditylenchus dipsaci TaxID=166011 RepID=A0A915CSY8_9BILA
MISRLREKLRKEIKHSLACVVVDFGSYNCCVGPLLLPAMTSFIKAQVKQAAKRITSLLARDNSFTWTQLILIAAENQQLRFENQLEKLEKAQVDYASAVIKSTAAKRAAENTDFEKLQEELQGISKIVIRDLSQQLVNLKNCRSFKDCQKFLQNLDRIVLLLKNNKQNVEFSAVWLSSEQKLIDHQQNFCFKRNRPAPFISGATPADSSVALFMCSEVNVYDPDTPDKVVKAVIAFDTMSSKSLAADQVCDDAGIEDGQPDSSRIWGMNDRSREPTAYNSKKLEMMIKAKGGPIKITPTEMKDCLPTETRIVFLTKADIQDLGKPFTSATRTQRKYPQRDMFLVQVS